MMHPRISFVLRMQTTGMLFEAGMSRVRLGGAAEPSGPALRPKGYDPDDPGVVEAIELVRLKLALLGP